MKFNKELAKKIDDLYFKLAKEDKELLEKILDAFEECAKQRQELEQENKKLKESLDFLLNKFKKVNTANRKAKELIRKALVETDITGNATLNLNELLEILGDKE